MHLGAPLALYYNADRWDDPLYRREFFDLLATPPPHPVLLVYEFVGEPPVAMTHPMTPSEIHDALSILYAMPRGDR